MTPLLCVGFFEFFFFIDELLPFAHRRNLGQQEEASESREVSCRSYRLLRESECKQEVHYIATAGCLIYDMLLQHTYHVT